MGNQFHKKKLEIWKKISQVLFLNYVAKFKICLQHLNYNSIIGVSKVNFWIRINFMLECILKFNLILRLILLRPTTNVANKGQALKNSDNFSFYLPLLP
jgi:hypothetical protein